MKVYEFNAEKVRDRLVELIRETAERQGFSRVVIGISGGKDSTVTAALCARALGKENVYGVMLPDGEQKDISDSRMVCESLGIRQRTVNIGAMHKALKEVTDQNGPVAAEGEFSVAYSRAADINVGPRLRMTTLRYIAQALDARLAGTGNLSEATTGYCTKDGDTSCDFSVLGGLTSVEVVQVGLTMEEIPKELVLKTPSDGLCGMSDEEKLGVSYDDIHKYIRGIEGVPAESTRKIQEMQKKNMHKTCFPQLMYRYVSGPWEDF